MLDENLYFQQSNVKDVEMFNWVSWRQWSSHPRNCLHKGKITIWKNMREESKASKLELAYFQDSFQLKNVKILPFSTNKKIFVKRSVTSNRYACKSKHNLTNIWNIILFSYWVNVHSGPFYIVQGNMKLVKIKADHAAFNKHFFFFFFARCIIQCYIFRRCSDNYKK